MIHDSKTIGELQAEIEASLSRLRRSQLPAGLEALRYLAPPTGLAARVSLRYIDGHRRIKRTADADYWDPQGCEAIVSFELDDESPGEEANSTAANGEESNVPDLRIRDLILALDAAERDPRFMGFVGIKAFRDQYLPSRGYAWAADQAARHSAIAIAIDSALILRTSIANPNRPDYPTTAVKMNREHPVVASVLNATAKERAVFNPVRIRGKSMSMSVIEERR